MTLERVRPNTSWTSPSGNFRHDAPFGGLAVAPVIYVGGVALVAIGTWLGNWLRSPNEDWGDNRRFKDRARILHSQMLSIQCAVVGAKADIKNLDGRVVCPAGSKSNCKPSSLLLSRWGSFMDNYASFFREATGRVLGPSTDDGEQLKLHVKRAEVFAHDFAKVCPDVRGTISPAPDEKSSFFSFDVPWGTLIGVGIGAVAVLALLRTSAAPQVIYASERLESGARGARDRFLR